MKPKAVLKTLAVILFATVALSTAPSTQAGHCSSEGVAGRWGCTYTGAAIILPTGAVPVAMEGSLKLDAAGNMAGSQTRSVGGSSGVEVISGKNHGKCRLYGYGICQHIDQSGTTLLRTAALALV